MEKMDAAIRQYRHNNSDGFVMGYDIAETAKIFASMQAEIEILKKQVEDLNGELMDMSPI